MSTTAELSHARLSSGTHQRTHTLQSRQRSRLPRNPEHGGDVMLPSLAGFAGPLGTPRAYEPSSRDRALLPWYVVPAARNIWARWNFTRTQPSLTHTWAHGFGINGYLVRQTSSCTWPGTPRRCFNPTRSTNPGQRRNRARASRNPDPGLCANRDTTTSVSKYTYRPCLLSQQMRTGCGTT